MKKTDPYFNMVVVGGILGGYAIAGFHGTFASAQTANMIAIIQLLVGKNFGDVVYRILAVFVFMMGIATSEWIKMNEQWNVKKVSIGIDLLTIIWMAFAPLSENIIIAVYPIWFATAFQWNTYSGAEGYVSSCIFSTNNLKQFTLAMTRYICKKDDGEKQKAFHFGKVILCFHLGVLAACICYPIWGRRAVLLALLPGIAAFRKLVIGE